jgi:hypothetical protein
MPAVAEVMRLSPVNGDEAGATNETKREAFVRLAERRTTAVLDRIRILSNLGNVYAYEWEEEDIRRIFGAIDEELRLARQRFQRKIQRRREFKL